MPYYSAWYDDYDLAGEAFNQCMDLTKGTEVAVYTLQLPPALDGWYVVVIGEPALDWVEVQHTLSEGVERQVPIQVIDGLWERHLRNRGPNLYRHGPMGQWINGKTGEDVDPFGST